MSNGSYARYDRSWEPPPSFDEAKNSRQRVRSAGLDPNHWYVVARVGDIKRGETREVVFWRRSIALFRGEDGVHRAIENRCAHRQLARSSSGGDAPRSRSHRPYTGADDRLAA